MSFVEDTARPHNLVRRMRFEENIRNYKDVVQTNRKLYDSASWERKQRSRASARRVPSSERLGSRRKDVAALRARSIRLKEKIRSELERYEAELKTRGLAFDIKMF